MSSNTKRLLLSILIALLLTVCLATLWSLLSSYRLRSTAGSRPSDKLASIQGWKIHRSNGNTTVYRGSIESFTIERAKLGPFAIGPLRVARLQKVVIDFYLEGLLSNPGPAKRPANISNAEPEKHPSKRSNAQSAKDLSRIPPAEPQKSLSKISAGEPARHPSKIETFGIDTLEGPLTDIQSGLFYRSSTTRIVEITGICLNLWAGEKRVFKISSDHARIDRQTRDLVFIGHASLDAAENGSIISHRITWVRKTSLFRIKDPFVLTKAAETKEGTELETDYQLKTINYHIKG
jgi:hypothetical protein